MVNQKKLPKPIKNYGVNIIRFFQSNYKVLLFTSFLFILNCVFIAITCVNKDVVVSSKRFLIVIILTIIINLILCIFVLSAKLRKLPIEKIFLVLGSILGIIYMFVIPIGRAPDEPAHIWRVYAITQGDILTETQGEENGNFLPDNIADLGATYTENAYSQLADRISEPISNNQTFHQTITSNPIDYTPQTFGILTGRLLNLPMIVTLYLSRFFGLIFCIIILYFCIKYIPILKKPLLFITCLPLSMQTFVSISYDGMIFCSATAIITFVLYTIYQSKYKIKFSHGFILTLLNFVLIAVKPVYFPICFLLFFIPSKCFKDKKQKAIFIITIFSTIIGLFLLWASLSIVTQPGNGADTNGQISFILSNPFRYIAILVHNISNVPFIYLQRLGALEWLDVHTSDFYILSTLIVFTILCVEEYYTTKKITLPKYFHPTIIIIAILTIVSIFSALYIQWTPVGSYIIEGVQTRYFLPILISIPLATALCTTRNRSYNNKKPIENIFLYIFLIFLNFNAITILLCSHI